MALKLVLIISLILSVCALNSAQESDDRCTATEEFNSCGSACPETCETVLNVNQGPKPCTMNCVSGCFCKPGLVRNNFRHNECVPRDECKKSLQRDGGNNSSNTLLENKISLISVMSSIALIFMFTKLF